MAEGSPKNQVILAQMRQPRQTCYKVTRPRIIGRMKHTLHQEQLSCGVRVLLVDVPYASTFSFSTVVRAGFKYADPKAFELPHLLEHLAFDGTKQHPTPAEFAFVLEGEGTDSNASTSADLIRYYYNGGRTDLENIMDLACGQLVDSIFEESAIVSEKGVVDSELSRLLENDSHMCSMVGVQYLEPLFGLSYPERIAQFDGITRQAIVDYYRSTHVGNNTCIILAGDFGRGKDVARLVAQLEQRLGTMPKGKQHRHIKNDLPKGFKSQVLVTNSLKKSEGYFELDFINTDYTEDLGQRVAMRVFNTILGGGSASRLFLSTRLKGLSYGPQVTSRFDRNLSTAGFYDRAKPAKLLPLFTECMEQTFAIVRGDYTDAELERARGYMRGDLQSGFERPADLASWYGSNFVWGKELKSPDDALAELAAVTRQDIAAMGDKFYKSGNWLLSVRAPEGSVDAAAYRAVIEAASK